MTSYSENFRQSNGVRKLVNLVVGGSKHAMNPEHRAKTVIIYNQLLIEFTIS